MALRFDAAARSEIGPARGDNQDTIFVSSTLLCVADGVGGAPAGDLASAVAVLSLVEAYRGQPDCSSSVYRQAVLDMQAAFEAIASDRPDLKDMATTLTALLIDGDKGLILHIGDSRAYRLRGEHLEQLSRDHTFVERLVQNGDLDPTEAFGHPARNLVLKVFDVTPHLLDFRVIELSAGDRILLCSDGLSDYVPTADIRHCLRDEQDPHRTAKGLVDRALDVPTRDNVSVAVADVEAATAVPRRRGSRSSELLLGSAAGDVLGRYGISEIARWVP